MSELAQRIITSHKEAAKRAVAFLGTTRKLKLSSTESLELVASVLGVANWQTLLAMAKDCRGPRIDEGTQAQRGTAVATEETIERRLSDYFATVEGWGEHPDFPVADWQYEVENDSTRLGYWAHVEAEIERTGAMLPWERAASFHAQLCDIFQVSVEASSEDSSWLICDPNEIVFQCIGQDEKSALRNAAGDLERHIASSLEDVSANELEAFTDAQWLVAAHRVADSNDSVPADYLDNEHLLRPGEMTKDSRKFCDKVPLCRSLGIEPVYSDERADEGYYWTIDEEEFFATEADAWDSEAKRLRAEVLSAMDIAPATWDCSSLDRKIELAKRYCLFPFG